VAPPPTDEALLPHHPQDLARVPHVDEVDGTVAQKRDEEGVEHADEMAYRCSRDLRRTAGREELLQLAGLAPDGAVGVHDPLGITCRARREAHHGRSVRIDRHRLGQGRTVQPRAERRGRGGQLGVRRLPHHQPLGVGRTGQERLVEVEVVGMAEAIGGHDDVGGRGPEDVVDLLGPVEVHDRDDHRPQVGGGPEGDARLDPVRELDDYHVTRSDPPGL
jgi:hypothetical protein